MLRFRVIILLVVAAVVGICATILLISNAAPYTEVVETSTGPIRGEEIAFEETHYKAFKGIPYAAPPTGDLRFRDPQPPKEWISVRDTRTYGKRCHQPKSMWGTSEDCLSLNVYTPSLSKKVLRPVLVCIHGGAFYAGDGTDTLYGPQYLVQQRIVVVTMNYRLGALGFLAANTGHTSGNWALKDQVAALKWVQENIAQFGGDPKQVTIYGQSAGAISVHLHLFSPLSKGLFHKAIVASGSAIMSRAVKTPDQMDKYSQNIARLLGASEDEIKDPTKRINFLRHADPQKMTNEIFETPDIEERMHDPLMNTVAFVPVIEHPDADGAFLSEEPRKLLSEGRYTRVPMMMGVTDLEGGVMFTGLGKNIEPEVIRDIEANVCQILPEGLRKAVAAKNDCAKVAQQIRDVYFEGHSFDSSRLNFINLCGDLFMVTSVHDAQRIHARNGNKTSPIYNYYFTMDGKWNMLKKLYKIGLPGATHGDDLTYMFKPAVLNLPSLPPTSPEVITRDRMVGFVANFVKHGNPTPLVYDLFPLKWEPAQEKRPTTMVIGSELKLEDAFLKVRMDLWDRLNEEYIGESA